MSEYDWLPTLCRAADDPRGTDCTKKPWALTIGGEGWTAVTNGYLALYVRGIRAGAMHGEPSMTLLALLTNSERDTQIRGSVALSTLRAWSTCPPLEEKRERCGNCHGEGRIRCEECRGRGSYDCECECGGCSHRVDCEECNKTGRVLCGCDKGEKVTKVNEVIPGNLGYVYVNRRYVNLAVEHLDGDSQVAVRTGGTLDAMMFEGDGWKVVVMPFRAEGLDPTDRLVTEAVALTVAA